MTQQEAARRRREVANAVRNGEPSWSICQRLGVTPGTIVNACKEHGIDRPRSKPSAKAFDILARLINEPEKSWKEIALFCNTSETWVNQIYHKAIRAGIKVPERALHNGVKV